MASVDGHRKLLLTKSPNSMATLFSSSSCWRRMRALRSCSLASSRFMPSSTISRTLAMAWFSVSSSLECSEAVVWLSCSRTEVSRDECVRSTVSSSDENLSPTSVIAEVMFVFVDAVVARKLWVRSLK